MIMNNSTANKPTMKPFCKVCYDTGKSESEYTSHFVKDVPGPKGIVVCPTLLSLECRYCKKIGHTVSRCPAVYEKRKMQKKTQNYAGKKEEKSSFHVTNIFHALDVDDENSEDEEKEENQTVTLTRNPNSYASVLLRDATIPRSPSTSPPPLFEPYTPDGSPPSIHKISKKMNWADEMSDSDEDF